MPSRKCIRTCPPHPHEAFERETGGPGMPLRDHISGPVPGSFRKGGFSDVLNPNQPDDSSLSIAFNKQGVCYDGQLMKTQAVEEDSTCASSECPQHEALPDAEHLEPPRMTVDKQPGLRGGRQIRQRDISLPSLKTSRIAFPISSSGAVRSISSSSSFQAMSTGLTSPASITHIKFNQPPGMSSLPSPLRSHPVTRLSRVSNEKPPAFDHGKETSDALNSPSSLFELDGRRSNNVQASLPRKSSTIDANDINSKIQQAVALSPDVRRRARLTRSRSLADPSKRPFSLFKSKQTGATRAEPMEILGRRPY